MIKYIDLNLTNIFLRKICWVEALFLNPIVELAISGRARPAQNETKQFGSDPYSRRQSIMNKTQEKQIKTLWQITII